MLELVLLIFALALLLYALFAGADFGAGMVELLAKKSQRAAEEHVISHAMAPVWEVNHIWLILALVILFTAFPAAYADITTIFHIPLTLMLVGIILRGCAFTFRHYDPFEDDSRRLYSMTFIASSFITPFAQGLVVGGCILGAIPSESQSFADLYVWPWLNIFSLSVSIFVCSLFFFLASVFLVGETVDLQLRAGFIQRVRTGVAMATTSAALVFIAAHFSGFPLWSIFISHISVLAVPLSALSVGLVWLALNKQRALLARVFAATAVGSVLVGWFGINYPFIIGGHKSALRSLNLYDVAAPAATLTQLLIALGVGSILIFPALIYLLKTFKAEAGSGD